MLDARLLPLRNDLARLREMRLDDAHAYAAGAADAQVRTYAHLPEPEYTEASVTALISGEIRDGLRRRPGHGCLRGQPGAVRPGGWGDRGRLLGPLGTPGEGPGSGGRRAGGRVRPPLWVRAGDGADRAGQSCLAPSAGAGGLRRGRGRARRRALRTRGGPAALHMGLCGRRTCATLTRSRVPLIAVPCPCRHPYWCA